MLKKSLVVILFLVFVLSMTACKDTWYADQKQDAYAFISTSYGEVYTLKAYTYYNSVHTAQETAINNPYRLYMEENDTATIVFACTACEHNETVESVTAPAAFFFECSCVNGDENPDMTEALAINFILGSPPAEEG